MSNNRWMFTTGEERQCGLTSRQLLNLAKREGWPIREIYGRKCIASRPYKKWLHSQPFIKRNGREFENVNTGLRWTYAKRRR